MTAPDAPEPQDPSNQPPQTPYTPPGPYPPGTFGPAGYPPPSYQQFPGYAPPPVRDTDGMAIASIVLSGLSVPLLLCYGAGGFFGFAGVVFGYFALRRLKTSGRQGRGLALSGILIGGVVSVISVVFWVLAIMAMSMHSYSY